MPTMAENHRKWNGTYHWNGGGDNWSEPWGNAEMQWHASILPRIHTYLPAPSILEIAPGFGRWTQFLKQQCQELTVVDLSARCIEACQQRFAADKHIRYHVNDGLSLSMVPDHSIDFAFSFDSLVHVERNVIESYLLELARVLKPQGVAFLHHSNIAAHRTYFRLVRGVPGLRLLARVAGLETKMHGRGEDVSAEVFHHCAGAVGLHCVSQEWINWRSPLTIDCLTVCTPRGSQWDVPRVVLRNRRFMGEAAQIRALAPLYSKRIAEQADSHAARSRAA
jgi:SAM-dependent methyltransferase